MLPCCRAAAQAYRQTPRWTAANLPRECTCVRCDVSGSCPSKLFCTPITRCKAGLGAVATYATTFPPHASVPKKKITCSVTIYLLRIPLLHSLTSTMRPKLSASPKARCLNPASPPPCVADHKITRASGKIVLECSPHLCLHLILSFIISQIPKRKNPASEKKNFEKS